MRSGALAAIAASVAALCFAAVGNAAAKDIELTFYYPISVGGPIPKIIDGYVAAFEKENPKITIKAIYAGTYDDALAKTLTAFKSGRSPDIAVLLTTDLFTLIDQGAIEPIDPLLTSEADRSWFASFYPVFMANARADGRTWSIPFQRSTILMFTNKDALRAAGLDPDKAPDTWDDLIADGQKLTLRDAAGNVTQWGVEIPSTSAPHWLLQGLSLANGTRLANATGTRTYFDAPGAIQALQFWTDLNRKSKIEPPGTIDWATTPRDFFERKAAIIWTSTGNLSNVRANAPFPFGVGIVPARATRGTPTGGGNFYLFKNMSGEQRQGALKFVEWMTTPERAADWSIATGYIAVRPDAWDTPAMRAYAAGFPQAAVARDELKYAAPELSTHEDARISKVLDDNIQAALIGRKSPAQAMHDAQQAAERILRPYR